MATRDKGAAEAAPTVDDLAAAPAAEAAAEREPDVVELESLPASERHAEAMPSLLADGSRQHPESVLLDQPEDGDPRAAHFEG